MSDDDYSTALEKSGRDLVEAARQGRLAPVDFREAEIARVIGELDRRHSVLLVGPTGVGKTSIIQGVAQALAARGAGDLVSLSTVSVLAGTRYLGEWQSKITRIVKAATDRKATLYFTDVAHLPKAGATVQSDTSMLDAMAPALEAREVLLLGEVTPEVLRLMAAVPGFVERFQTITVEPLADDEVKGAVDRAATRRNLPVEPATRDAIIQLTHRFLPSRPQPAPSLDLLEQVDHYLEQKRGIGEPEELSPAFVEKVFSIYTGLPLFVVSRTETQRAADIRQWFDDRIVGQEEAIEAVVETIALFKAGLHDPTRPIGTLLFVGPTGVGKTEVARALATFLFGSPHRLLRFDLSEFKDYHAFELLLGSASNPNRPARLVDPVRAQPFQIVLFDELEKAHPNVWDLLLPLLDEGRLTTPAGDTVDFRSTLFIATSNAGAKQGDTALGFGADGGGQRVERTQAALEQHFRPELLNRFQHLVVFRPLTTEQIRTVARQELRRILRREGISGRNLVVDVDDEALDLVIARGVDQRYGARALKREIQRQIVLPLAITIMEKDVEPGQLLKVTGRDAHIRIRLLDTPESRSVRKEKEPVRIEGRRLTKPDLLATVQTLRQSIEDLGLRVNEAFLLEERTRLLELRSEPAFWQHPDHAARALRDLDLATVILDRLDRLRSRAESITSELSLAETRREIARIVDRTLSLERGVESAFRELAYMGEDGVWDALVEIAPVGDSGEQARDMLVETYRRWATWQRMQVEWLRVPLESGEPAMFAVKGRYAHGLLGLESGLHRVRDGEDRSVARVRVAAWTDRSQPVVYGMHRALKGLGHYGQRIRSRLECEGGLVLQNWRTLAENRDLALELAGSWADALAPQDAIVRRYDLVGPHLRDVLTGFTSGRPDALEAEPFHRLLCMRVDAAQVAPEPA